MNIAREKLWTTYWMSYEPNMASRLNKPEIDWGFSKISLKQTLRGLGNLINKLVKIAYLHQDVVFRTKTSLELFSRLVWHTGLKQNTY